MEGKISVTENSKYVEITINPDKIGDELLGKISAENIKFGLDTVKKQVRHVEICNKIDCCEKQCPYATDAFHERRTKPNGNIEADIAILNDSPSDYEALVGSSGIDTWAAYLSMIFGKMNIKRSWLYWTDLMKCRTAIDPNLEELSTAFHNCFEYLLKEFNVVRPKLIICNGLTTLKRIQDYGIMQGLPDNLAYGTIYNVSIDNNFTTLQTKIMGIYNINNVLLSKGERYEKAKQELWKQLVTGVNSLSEGGTKTCQ